MKIHYDRDCPPALGEPVAVIGYGSQGRAHALNLRDSGEDVRVGLYPGSKSIERVEADGLRAVPVPEAVSEATVVMVLTPDAGQGKLFRESIEKHLQPGTMLMFAHGFSIHFAQIKPDQNIDVAMIAPKGPGHLVRSTYVQGMGVPALIADPPGRLRPRASSRAGLRKGARRRPCRNRRDDVQGRDGNGPFRRAGRALRRHQLPRQDGLRDAGRGGLSA